jgi:hypothetical protein
MTRFGPCRFCVISFATLFALATSSLAQAPGAGVSIVTWQNDTHRTGQNVNEATLISPLTQKRK